MSTSTLEYGNRGNGVVHAVDNTMKIIQRILLFHLYYLICFFPLYGALESSEDKIKIPKLIKLPIILTNVTKEGVSRNVVDFYFSPFETPEKIYRDIKVFCDEHNPGDDKACDVIWKSALDYLSYSNRIINYNLKETSPNEVEQNRKKEEHSRYWSTGGSELSTTALRTNVIYDNIPFTHMERNVVAQDAEIKLIKLGFPLHSDDVNITHYTKYVRLHDLQSLYQQDDHTDLERAWETMKNHLRQRVGRRLDRVIVIHSASLHEGNVLLDEILLRIGGTLEQSYVSSSPWWDELIVVNHGIDIPHSFKEKHNKLVTLWVQYARDTSRFEIPTLQLLRRLALHLTSPQAVEAATRGQDLLSHDAQFIYLHTKGASYKEDYSNIRDWRRLMLHAMVDRHEMGYHLLKSGVFDCVGVNYRDEPFPHFSGNFFTASAAYIASLAPIPHRSTKYQAEFWVLSEGPRTPRIYNLHDSIIHLEYPTFLYDTKRLFLFGSKSLQEGMNIRVDKKI